MHVSLTHYARLSAESVLISCEINSVIPVIYTVDWGGAENTRVENTGVDTAGMCKTQQCIKYTVFHKKTVPFVILLYLYFYEAKFHENPHEHTGGIGRYAGPCAPSPQ